MKPYHILLLPVFWLMASCASTDSVTTTKAPDGTITVTESLESMKARLFEERCNKVLEGTGL
jgi:hypothetical protein